jgi:hypothetical protein
LAARRRRFAEYVELTARFIASDHIEFQGEFFSARGSLPWADTGGGRPLIAVAGQDSNAMDLAVRHAGIWVANGPRSFRSQHAALDLDWLHDRYAHLRESCASHGRPVATLRKLFLLAPRGSGLLADTARVIGLAEELRAIGFTDIVCPFPAENTPYAMEIDTLEKLVESISEPAEPRLAAVRAQSAVSADGRRDGG